LRRLKLDGAEWMGRNLKVNKAKPREDRGSSGGRQGNSRGYSTLLSVEPKNLSLSPKGRLLSALLLIVNLVRA